VPAKHHLKAQESKPTKEKQESKKIIEENKKCTCLCKCLGQLFQYKNWGYNKEMLDNLKLEDGSIKILYKDTIKVFYKNQQEAKKCNYTEYEAKTKDKGKKGYVYSFTGLRGDAKELYTNVVEGREKRIELVKAPTP